MATGTRERIMDVALRLFAEQGVAATPITAIEAGAGLSAGSGSFYRHFKDKPELLAAVVDREMDRVRKTPVVPATKDTTPKDALARLLLRDLDFLAELRPMMAILMWERGRAPQVAERVRQLMVERGVELGVGDLFGGSASESARADLAAAATVMMSAMVGYFLSVEFFGVPPAEVGAERFTGMLAELLTQPDKG